MSDKDNLDKLCRSIRNIIPYVTATLSVGNTFPSKERDGWVEVHGGRVDSSKQQLEYLLHLVDRIERPDRSAECKCKCHTGGAMHCVPCGCYSGRPVLDA